MWKFSRGHVLERVQVPGRRAARLGAGDVEADHARVPVPHRQLGDLQRPGRGAHRGEQRVHGDARGPALPRRKPSRTASTTCVQAQPAGQVQLGGEPDLRVDDAVGGEVLGALGRDPDQGLAGLHHRRPCAGTPPGSTSGGRGARPGAATCSSSASVVRSAAGRNRSHAASSTTVAGPQPAVQVVVQQHLRDALDLLERRSHAAHFSQTIRSISARGLRWLPRRSHRPGQRGGRARPNRAASSAQQLQQRLAPLDPLARLGQADARRPPALTGSSLRARPAPSRQAATPTARASRPLQPAIAGRRQRPPCACGPRAAARPGRRPGRRPSPARSPAPARRPAPPPGRRRSPPARASPGPAPASPRPGPAALAAQHLDRLRDLDARSPRPARAGCPSP